MIKYDLKNVTVVCIDSVSAMRGVRAINNSLRQLPQAKGLLITHDMNFSLSDNVSFRKCEPIGTKYAYSQFIIQKLADFIDTDFALVVQWDGHVINGLAWTNEFLEYDYIGAPWSWDKVVGNGGFSLRSSKLLRFTKDFFKNASIEELHPEDAIICRTFRKEFEAEGFKFAPLEIAYRFSVENEPYTDQLGWHGGDKPFVI